MEKNILSGMYDDENEDDLNKAQLSLNNENSLIIENLSNFSTPIYYKPHSLKIDNLIFKNHIQSQNYSSSSMNNFNLTNLKNNPIAKTYMEENPDYLHQNINNNLFTPVHNFGHEKINYTSETHRLSLSEFSNHSHSPVRGITFNNGNSGILNNFTNVNTNSNTNYILYKEQDYFKNNFQHFTKNKTTSNSNYYFQEKSSFCLDQNHLTQVNPNNYTYNDNINSNYFNFTIETFKTIPIKINNINYLPTNNYYNSYSYEEKHILDNALNYTNNDNGCRLIQKKIEEGKYDFTSKFFEKVLIF